MYFLKLKPEHAFGQPFQSRDNRNLLCFAVEGIHPVQGWPILSHRYFVI